MKLKQYLEENNIPKIDAAKALDITYTHLHMVMTGERNPSEALARAIVKLCKGKVKYEDIRIVKMKPKRKPKQDLMV